jgi:TetR/AcrR family transcriptional repressor of nem operon
MRYGAEHKQRTRERVLTAAAQAIRVEGPHKIGVADVMADVGLTHGGFYAHFVSKDDLIVAALELMFDNGERRLEDETKGVSPARGLTQYIDFYLSAEHRDSREIGCPLPYLSADAPRLSAQSREAFAAGLARLTDRLARKLEELGQTDARVEAASTLSELVGALSLARADPDPGRSDAILAVSRTALKRRFGLETT